MRKSVTLVSAVLVTVAATSVGSGHAQSADTSGSASSSRVSDAIAAAKSHAGTTRFGSGQALKAVSTVVDADGTSHVRLHRTYRAVTGIGRTAAARIWFRALTVYMTSSTNYTGARTATLNAARDLYGLDSTQRTAVAAAWSAVTVS